MQPRATYRLRLRTTRPIEGSRLRVTTIAEAQPQWARLKLHPYAIAGGGTMAQLLAQAERIQREGLDDETRRAATSRGHTPTTEPTERVNRTGLIVIDNGAAARPRYELVMLSGPEHLVKRHSRKRASACEKRVPEP